jgi:PAS domain S-box-containing protein
MVQQILDSQHKLLSEMTKYSDKLDLKNQELTNANKSLQTIVRATSQTGEEFLKVFVKNLASAMNAKYAAVMEVFNEGKNIRIIANWDNKHYGQNFEYPIADTPCEIVMQKGLFLFDNNVKSKFGNNQYLLDRKINYYLGIPLKDSEEKSIGIISVFDDKAIELNKTNEFIMKIFAARVSSELERIKSEIALRESEIKFRTLGMSAQDAIIMMDSEGKISFWNEAAERIFGYSILEAMGKDVHALLAPKDVYKPYIEGMKKFRKTGQGKVIGSIQEMIALTKDGNTLAIELSLSSVMIKGFWEAIGIARDVTARKKMEEDLQNAMQKAEEANLAKSEFLANMSHEIRTPMNAIMGFSQILRSKINDENLNSYLESISTSGKNLLGLINDILDLSKIEAGKLSLEYDAVNPHKLFKEIENIFVFDIKEKGLDFIIDVDKDIPKGIIIDEIRLRQILVNLVGNALKFTDSGYIKLSVKNESYNVDYNKIKLKFCVEDSGIGIPEEELERIFDAFIQQSGQSTRKYGGTGLGLAISKRLVNLMSGKIYVESEKDKGSKFIVILDNIAVDTSNTIQDSITKDEYIKNSNQDKIYLKDEEISQELKTIFISKILPERNRIKSGLIIGQVSEFAIELKELSIIHNNHNLKIIADLLNVQAINFDILNLRKTLDDLDNFIKLKV